MTSKEAFNQGFIKKAQEYGAKEFQAVNLLKRAAFGENTKRIFENFTQSEGGKRLIGDGQAIGNAISTPNTPALDALAEPAMKNIENWSSKLGPWIQDRAKDYGLGAAGGGALAAGGGAIGGGLLGKGLGHFAGYLAGGNTDQEKAEKKRSWGNIGAGIGGPGGALAGGAAAGLGGPLAGLWNADRAMGELPSY